MKEKFLITIESYHIGDNGFQSNVSKMGRQTSLTEVFFLSSCVSCLLAFQTYYCGGTLKTENKNNFYIKRKLKKIFRKKNSKKNYFRFYWLVD